jgi:hypothetical protein
MLAVNAEHESVLTSDSYDTAPTKYIQGGWNKGGLKYDGKHKRNVRNVIIMIKSQHLPFPFIVMGVSFWQISTRYVINIDTLFLCY